MDEKLTPEILGKMWIFLVVIAVEIILAVIAYIFELKL
jgi:hypothetical protein